MDTRITNSVIDRWPKHDDMFKYQGNRFELTAFQLNISNSVVTRCRLLVLIIANYFYIATNIVLYIMTFLLHILHTFTAAYAYLANTKNNVYLMPNFYFINFSIILNHILMLCQML